MVVETRLDFGRFRKRPKSIFFSRGQALALFSSRNRQYGGAPKDVQGREVRFVLQQQVEDTVEAASAFCCAQSTL